MVENEKGYDKSIKYKKGYKYQLCTSYACKIDVKPEKSIATDYIILTKRGNLVLKKGYAWDGASGPFTLDTKTNMRGSLVHDALYQLMREEYLPQEYREQADREFQKICIEDGMCKLRAKIDFIGLNKFGAYAASPKNARKVCVAP